MPYTIIYKVRPKGAVCDCLKRFDSEWEDYETAIRVCIECRKERPCQDFKVVKVNDYARCKKD